MITATADLTHQIPHQSGGHTIIANVMTSPVVDASAWAHVPHVGALVAVGAVGAAVAGTVVAQQNRAPRRGWLTLWMRLRWRVHPGPGFATRWELWRHYGRPAARKVAAHGRPSLTWVDLHFGSWRQYATFQGWAQGWLHRWRVYSTFEDITLIISAPQEGKSAKAAGSVIDAPGPVVATSIRGDLIAATAGLRQKVGQLHVFNPEGVGEYGSTFAWNPVAGSVGGRFAERGWPSARPSTCPCRWRP